MMSTEVYWHIQQMKITITEYAFILPYSKCRLYHTVKVSIGLWLSDGLRG